MADSTQNDFKFVMQDPNRSFTKKTRTVIKKQAMRAVGATRRKTDPSSNKNSTIVLRRPTRRDLGLGHPLPPMPLSGLELLVRDRGIDPIDLSALTSIHIGTIASTIFASEPSRLSGVLLCHQRSYFSFIPSRFGHSLVLDDAFRCLITVVHSMLVPDHKPSQDKILSCYGKALHSLQSAVSDPAARYSTEAICATAILALFELLESPKGQLWSQHIAGASRLIQLKGPSRFTSEFDKALLISLSYPICAEALLNNEACFLDNPKWIEALTAACIPNETFSDRSALGIDLIILKSKIPGLVKKTNHAVFIQETLQPKDFDALADEIRVVRTAIVTWRRKFNTALLHAEPHPQNKTIDFAKRYELLGISLIINIMLSRLLASIVPNDRALLEEEAQNLAIELKSVQGSLGHSKRAQFYFEQKAKLADAAIDTHEEFREEIGSGRVVESWRLERFFEAIGRKCCDGKTCCERNG
ncbi:hypothetical protein G7Y89_g15456 [Cudoniella acicularis]|uniref:Uncharacterized protein n=1 Tax=Cudoniella acicularis TaxID=354080 RepID=A0A8H4QMC3_9HELO|nr:hypothetical protein G7Y89_g15456 [Cudoniella acicularis]